MISLDSTRTIAVVQLGRLGDTILTTPLLDALRTLAPHARITLIASPDAASIARHHGAVDDVMETGRGAIGLGGALLRLRTRALDLYIDPKDHRSSTSRLLAAGARAERMIVDRANATARSESLPPAAAPGHFVDRMLAPLRLLAPDHVAPRRPRLDLPAAAAPPASRLIAEVGDRYAVVNISAGSPSRHWGVDRTIAVVQWLGRSVPVAIVAAPADRATAHAIASTTTGARAVDTASLLELAAIVAGSSLLLSPDTAVVHLASAYDIPTVGLYPSKPDNLRLFAPLASRREVVIAPDDGTIADIAIASVIDALGRVAG